MLCLKKIEENLSSVLPEAHCGADIIVLALPSNIISPH
jgi:hypothetical protein